MLQEKILELHWPNKEAQFHNMPNQALFVYGRDSSGKQKGIRFRYDKHNKLNLIVQEDSTTSLYTYFYKNGRTKMLLPVQDSFLQGNAFFYSPNGKIAAIYEYRNNCLSEIIFHSNKKWPPQNKTYLPVKVSSKKHVFMVE